MKTLKIDFCDFWPDFDKSQNFFINMLSNYFDVQIVSNPDFLFFSNYGSAHLSYTCIKIFYTGESTPPDYLQCDYSISFELEENDRNLRLPLYFLYGDVNEILSPKKPFSEIRNQHNRFCNMVVSNGDSKKRIDFFHQLSKYKQVDSGGRFLNNIGGHVEDKKKFISSYKFTFAFENIIYPGYTTEKVFEPMLCGSMPIYWGNPKVNLDFNTKSFVCWDDYGSDEAVINRIIELDQNDSLYEEVYMEPFFNGNKLNKYCDEQRVLNFLTKIFSSHFRNRKYYYSRQLTLDYYKGRIFLGGLKNKIKNLFQ
jgi:hypothetical protein